MLETGEIHHLVRSAEDFQSFVDEVNDQGSFYELFTAVERTGRDQEPTLAQPTIDEIDFMMLGWLRLVWKAHQEPVRGQTMFGQA